MSKKINAFLKKLERVHFLNAVRGGFIAVLPIVMIGAATLVFRYFPIAAYQSFIEDFLNGWFIRTLNLIYGATYGMMSVYLTFAISKAYIGKFDDRKRLGLVPYTSLMCFLILGYTDGSTELFGINGTFISIISALLSAKLLVYMIARKKKKGHKYLNGSDMGFNNSIAMLIPSLITVGIFAVVNIAAIRIFNVSGIVDLFVKSVNALLIPMGNSFLASLLYAFLTGFMWFFGIHGSNMLMSVRESVFVPALETNMALAAAGQAPTEIFTSEFFSVFVLMGGCGTAICLLIAILLFSRHRSSRQLSKLAALPMFFNINELMIFGLPVILNPIMFIPFILAPIAAFLVSYAAMRTGVVPLVANEVNWTAPVLFSGYMATGSVAGAVLQLVNMAIGTFIYYPFVRMYDKKFKEEALSEYKRLIDILRRSEESLVPVVLTEMDGTLGATARELVADLKYALSKNDITLYYQPQFNERFECTGAEALLRWKHPFYGWVYPPLIIRIAAEGGFAEDLEEYVVSRAISESAMMRVNGGMKGAIGINVSAMLIHSDKYLAHIKALAEENRFKKGEVCLEVTEQTALLSDAFTMDRLKVIKDLGYRLAIDDFSMGYTSVKYLQDTQFDIVKLDGSLIRGLKTYAQNRDIIESITSLSDKLGLKVVAEFVENEEQIEILKKAGCHTYQGAMYGLAMPYEDFMKKLKEEKKKRELNKEKAVM